MSLAETERFTLPTGGRLHGLSPSGLLPCPTPSLLFEPSSFPSPEGEHSQHPADSFPSSPCFGVAPAPSRVTPCLGSGPCHPSAFLPKYRVRNGSKFRVTCCFYLQQAPSSVERVGFYSNCWEFPVAILLDCVANFKIQSLC